MSVNRRRHVRGRGRHDGGASAVEYALIIAGVALASIVAIFALNRSVEAAYVQASDSMSGGTVSAGPAPSGTTTGPGPTSSSTSAVPTPSITTTTAAPVPSGTPTTTIATITKDAKRDKTTELIDLDVDGDDVGNQTASMTPPGAGSVKWDDEKLEIKVGKNTAVGTVITVTYSYVIDGVSYTGTVTVTVTKN